MSILTQHPVMIDLSVPAMEIILGAVCMKRSPDVQCEVDNFYNLLRNLIERSKPTVSNNEDLVS